MAVSRQSRVATFVFTDLVGYSALSQRSDRLALELIEEHRAFLRPLFAENGGKELKFLGDGFFLEFEDPNKAVLCCIEVQRALHERNRVMPPERQIKIRIGIHSGVAAESDGEVLGDAVNIASRLEGIARPGGICLSAEVAKQLSATLTSRLVPVGPVNLKNIRTPVEAYWVELPWEKSPKPSLERMRWRWNKYHLYLTTGAVIVIGVLGVWMLRSHSSVPQNPSLPLPLKDRIAVLPFRSIGPNSHQDEYLADGVTDELASSLRQIADLHVIAQTSSDRFKNSNASASDIGRKLNASQLIEGTVEKDGDEIRVSARLVDSRSEEERWSKDFHAPMKSIFEVQSSVASEIVSALAAKLSPEEAKRISKIPTSNLQAYDLYLRALYLSDPSQNADEAQLSRAVKLLTQALKMDPKFAKAYALRGHLYLDTYVYFHPDDTSLNENAFSDVNFALSLDPNLADGHIAKANLLWLRPTSQNVIDAIREYRIALRLDPNSADAHGSLALLYAHTGLLDLVDGELRGALQCGIEPSFCASTSAWNKLFQCDYAGALATLPPLQRDQYPVEWAYFKTWSLLANGNIEEAEKTIAWGLQQKEGENGYLHSLRAVIAGLKGDVKARTAEIQETLKVNPHFLHFHHALYDLAISYAATNDAPNAVHYLTRAAGEGFPCYPMFQRDKFLDKIRSSTEFKQFMLVQQADFEKRKASASVEQS